VDDSGTFSNIDTQTYVAKAIKSADNICQSTDYFCKDNRQMIGRLIILAPFDTAQTLLCGLSRTGTGDPVQDALLRLKVEFCKSVQNSLKAEGLASMGGMNLSSKSKTI